MSKKATPPGTVIGNVLVLGQTTQRRRSNIVYRLKCLLCGQTFEEILPDIRRGRQSSCNCLRRQWETLGDEELEAAGRDRQGLDSLGWAYPGASGPRVHRLVC